IDEGLGFSLNKSYIEPADFSFYRELFINRLNGEDSASKGCITVCGMLLDYLLKTQKNSLEHIKSAKLISDNDYMEIDANAKKHLELFETLSKEKKGSLLHLLDKTDTSMGGRLLRSWINKPILNLEKINARQNAVSSIAENPYVSSVLNELLSNVYDIERIISKLAYKTINARDCLSLKKSLLQLPGIKAAAQKLKGKYIEEIVTNLDTMEDICDLLERAINPEAPISIKEGDIINPEFNSDLKELYEISKNSQDVILKLENKEREETGIKNLKLGYNKVFGYYLEVTKSYYDKIPYHYIRKQTLVNCERFITEELKEIENKIVGADEKRIKLEYSLFEGIREALLKQISRFQQTADCISKLDCINSLGSVASEYGYTRPNITTDGVLKIEKGRHPIVERMTSGGFVANDAFLNTDSERFVIITGPNMAGKSTYMRQIALITILAHIGSFVPAASASIPLTSKIFTRIGALDNLSKGKSTFMVEMSELADIIENADKNSLIILDEIGRGTSTIDGVSIALAAVHYIASKIGAKTLFATHYHQLSNLEGEIEGVVNYKIAVSEEGDKVVFLHTIKRGGTDKSFGIYVAKLAGLPADFIAMANSIMAEQSEEDFTPAYNAEKVEQASLDGKYKEELDALLNLLEKADINNITPIQAITLLNELKETADEFSEV
ncbi:MAG: DNA mismatch repair protein MutS, partial [Clostridia bacterium]|nr:DNA mismatch repair protein MutS [Clostridia bacterium]